MVQYSFMGQQFHQLIRNSNSMRITQSRMKLTLQIIHLSELSPAVDRVFSAVGEQYPTCGVKHQSYGERKYEKLKGIHPLFRLILDALRFKCLNFPWQFLFFTIVLWIGHLVILQENIGNFSRFLKTDVTENCCITVHVSEVVHLMRYLCV